MLVQVNEEKEQQKNIVSAAIEDRVQAELDLAGHIQAITMHTSGSSEKKTKDIRNNRKKEVLKNHRNIAGEVIKDGRTIKSNS
ncbi:MAG: hypothetical protein K0R92_2191 [Lachnospiraceae bacterium]|nr:hypothetical protein [Lachnospiraceae bacterium]MDF2843451.1 hypothetical protein [Herbinix sp.]